MADGIITHCNMAWSWHWYRQVTAPCNVACGSRIMTLNSPCNVIRDSGITYRWIRPVAAPCNVTHSSGIMTLNSPGGSTLQCGRCRWLWDDMPRNLPKCLPYWNSTSGFDFDHITAVNMSFCTSLQKFDPNRTTLSIKNDVMSIFMMADLSHFGYFGVNIQDGGSSPSWILRVPQWVLWKAHVRLPIGRQ